MGIRLGDKQPSDAHSNADRCDNIDPHDIRDRNSRYNIYFSNRVCSGGSSRRRTHTRNRALHSRNMGLRRSNRVPHRNSRSRDRRRPGLGPASRRKSERQRAPSVRRRTPIPRQLAGGQRAFSYLRVFDEYLANSINSIWLNFRTSLREIDAPREGTLQKTGYEFRATKPGDLARKPGIKRSAWVVNRGITLPP